MLLIVRATKRWESSFSRLFERETARKERCGTSWHLGNQMRSRCETCSVDWATNESSESRSKLEFWVTRIRVSSPRLLAVWETESREVSCETEIIGLGNQIGDRCGANTIARATVASVVAEDDWSSRVTARNGVSKDELIAQESCEVRRIRR